MGLPLIPLVVDSIPLMGLLLIHLMVESITQKGLLFNPLVVGSISPNGNPPLYPSSVGQHLPKRDSSSFL